MGSRYFLRKLPAKIRENMLNVSKSLEILPNFFAFNILDALPVPMAAMRSNPVRADWRRFFNSKERAFRILFAKKAKRNGEI